MMMRLILTIATLAALPIGARPAFAQIAPVVIPDGTILDISAEGRTTRIPDLATVRAGVVSTASTAAAALGDNATRMNRVLAALKRAGIEPRDVQTANVSLNPQYRYADGKAPEITGYQANNNVSVRFRDIARAGPVLDALVAEGANQIDGPNLSIDQPDAALDEARVDAVKQARARAELYGKAAGLSVSRILSISEGGQNSAPQPVMFMARARGVVDSVPKIEAGESTVTVNVSVRFLLK
jgi:uncharacterized protein YggE